jgi:hypothetical protein
MEELVRLIIENDGEYLGMGNREENYRKRNPGGPQNTFNDPYFSFWTYYGLQGNRGPEIPYEYGVMFTDMVADFHANNGYNEDLRLLSGAVEETYHMHHPHP